VDAAGFKLASNLREKRPVAGAMVGAIVTVSLRQQRASEVGRNGKGSSSPRARRVGGRRGARGNARAACSKEQCLERHCLDWYCPSGQSLDRQRVAPRVRSPPKPDVANTYAASARSKRRESRGLKTDPTFEMVIP
jgi:hypothetical protein